MEPRGCSHLNVIICEGVNPSNRSTLLATKVLPHILATNSVRACQAIRLSVFVLVVIELEDAVITININCLLHRNKKMKKDALRNESESVSRKEAATYSPALRCSTIGAPGLNFSVRDGKRWSPGAKAT